MRLSADYRLVDKIRGSRVLMGLEEFHDRGRSPLRVNMPAGVDVGLNRGQNRGRVKGAVLAAGLAWPGCSINLAICFNRLLLQGERVSGVSLAGDRKDGARFGWMIRRKQPACAFAYGCDNLAPSGPQ